MMQTPETTPVILGIGEFIDRPERVVDALEPLDLMARALQAADADAGGGMLVQSDSIDVVGFVSWQYDDPVALLCNRVAIDPVRKTYAGSGGDTPIRLIHEAAVRIARGEQRVAVVVGGEAGHSRARAKKEKVQLPWTPMPPREKYRSSFAKSAIAVQLQVTQPAEIYPLYEMATQAAWRQSPDQAHRASAQLWAQYARVAASNSFAWIQKEFDASAIGTPSPENRLITWPYPKYMVANPNVNQAAAVIVSSLAVARAAGVPEDRMVYVWGGAAASESEDFLHRDSYARSTAMEATLEKAVALVGGEAHRFRYMELYSCFPVVPKMALRSLGLDPAEVTPTVAGGLTFFGGPLNNYMSHAVAAMVRKLREAPADVGLLYGQGGYLNRHHSLVIGSAPPSQPVELSCSVQDDAERRRGTVPPLNENYQGLATVETYTVLYARDGEPLHGVVVALTPAGERTMARVPATDADTLDLLLSTAKSAVGTVGYVRTDAFGKPVWSAGGQPAKRAPADYRYAKVEREGPLTIVTINRPESMNAFTPELNAELAEIFDDFAADSEQWVAIITGAGEKAFSAGNDLKVAARTMARGGVMETPLAGYGGLTARFDCPKPIIAAVNGVAMGGGFEVALACDLIIASETAVFALPEPKVGLAALAGGLLRLSRQLPLKQAMGLILTGRRVTAAEGLALGFVNEVVQPGQHLSSARRWAAEIIANSPLAVRASKEVVHRGLDEESLQRAYREQKRYETVKALFRSEDLREGPLSFAEKRPPSWKGR